MPHGANVLPRVAAIAMGSTPVISLPPRGALKISKWEDDREGEFQTQAFERYSRYEPEVAEGLTEMFVSGTSTRYQSAKLRKN